MMWRCAELVSFRVVLLLLLCSDCSAAVRLEGKQCADDFDMLLADSGGGAKSQEERRGCG